MKYIKMLGLAAVAAAALMAFVGASAAQATVLCSEAPAVAGQPCPAGKAYGVNQEIHAVLDAGTKAVLVAGFATVECSESTVKGKTTNAGSATTTVSGPGEALTFSSCTCGVFSQNRVADVTTTVLGSLEVHNIAGTNNGTLTSISTTATINCTGLATCNFGTKTTGTDVGTLTGGNPATLDASASLDWKTGDGSEFVCGNPGTWTAKYEVTTPKPLFVQPS